MALASRNPRALTIVVQTCIIVLIFCFAGCAAGSCLSYGHSCWGAHGKRSDGQVGATVRILAAKTSSNPHDDAPSSKTQWILSRLIAGQPVLPLSDKYRVRWSGLVKDKDAYASPKWEYNVAPANDESVDAISILWNCSELCPLWLSKVLYRDIRVTDNSRIAQARNIVVITFNLLHIYYIKIPLYNESNEKKMSNAQGIMRSEKLGNVPEIVLISPDGYDGYDKPINDFRKLGILEFLNKRNGNAK